jgi:hypothetical protein
LLTYRERAGAELESVLGEVCHRGHGLLSGHRVQADTLSTTGAGYFYYSVQTNLKDTKVDRHTVDYQHRSVTISGQSQVLVQGLPDRPDDRRELTNSTLLHPSLRRFE